MHPYRIRRTRDCLAKAGIHLVPSDPIPYPEVVGELDWGIRTDADICIVFAADRNRGAKLAQRFRQLAYSFGMTKVEIRRGIIRRGNFVFYANTFTGLTAKRRARVSGCLRR
jgi:hypothetical protein